MKKTSNGNANYVEQKVFDEKVSEMKADIKRMAELNAECLQNNMILVTFCRELENKLALVQNEKVDLEARVTALQNQIVLNASAPAVAKANKGAGKSKILSAPNVIVNRTTVRFAKGAITPYIETCKYAQFYETDVGHVLEIKFLQNYEPDSVELYNVDGTSLSFNNAMAIITVFGVIKYGSVLYYSSAVKSGTQDTIRIWPNTEAFALGKLQPTISKIISLGIGNKAPNVKCVLGRIQLNRGVFSVLNLKGTERCVEIKPIPGKTGEFLMTFSDNPTPGCVYMTPRKGSVPYEICNKDSLEELGFDPNKHKSVSYRVEAISDNMIRIYEPETIER